MLRTCTLYTYTIYDPIRVQKLCYKELWLGGYCHISITEDDTCCLIYAIIITHKKLDSKLCNRFLWQCWVDRIFHSGLIFIVGWVGTIGFFKDGNPLVINHFYFYASNLLNVFQELFWRIEQGALLSVLPAVINPSITVPIFLASINILQVWVKPYR